MSRRRVFITGIGMVSPHGTDPDDVFQQVCRGESAIKSVILEEAPWVKDPVPVAPADFEMDADVPRTQRLFMARASEMAVVAAHAAVEQAGFSREKPMSADGGVYVGCSLGGSEAVQNGYHAHLVKQRRARPTTVVLTMANGPTSHISISLGLQGPTMSYSMACASSAVAIGEAYHAIRSGSVNQVLAGGAEAMLNVGSLCAWLGLGVLAKVHPDGDHASCRPFDEGRTGFVLAEGAVVFVLESEDEVERRGATPLAEVVGYGLGSDAHNLTEPHKRGQIRSMRAALDDAGLAPEAIQYINAHATGTMVGDEVEIESIKETFGDHAYKLAVSATKSMHGHLVGAAGAMELAITELALRRGVLPPTAFLERPEPSCDLDLVPLVGREAPGLEYALSNSFAFGGTNASLILRKAPD